jgi:hypothetical protein
LQEGKKEAYNTFAMKLQEIAIKLYLVVNQQARFENIINI